MTAQQLPHQQRTDEQHPATATTLPETPLAEDLAKLDTQALIARYRLGIEHFDRRVFELSNTQLDRPFQAEDGAGLWSCRALIGHIFDTELLYNMRLRRTLAEDAPVLENFDEHAFIDSPLSGMHGRTPGEPGIKQPIGAMAASVHTLRQTMAAALYQLAPAEWDRRAMHPQRGPVTFRDLLAIATAHLEHHARFLNAKVERFLGPAPEPASCEDHAAKPGGCGSGCACAAPTAEP